MEALQAKFKKYDAGKYIKHFADNHMLIYASCLALMLGFSKKSLEILRLGVSNKLLKKLKKKYEKFIQDYKEIYGDPLKNETVSNKVWVCWFQGYEYAPYLVQRCIDSQREYFKQEEYILLTEHNYKQYVGFPDFIIEKFNQGVISRTHFSDLLRLELLQRYGGTWIDATVYVSGGIPSYMTDSELFVFQDLKPGADGHCTVLSSWFMTAKANNPIISLTLALLYKYWEENDKLIDYFLLHDFFQLALEAYPEEWNKVIPFSNSTPHMLLLRLFDDFDEDIWKAIKNQTPIHKLSYKFKDEQFEMKNTYYSSLFNEN